MKKNSKKVRKIENSGQPKTENRGKPSFIKNLSLEILESWPNSPTCVHLFKYLCDLGRHNYLHQAGKHSNRVDNNKKQEYNLDTKLRYEYVQEIVEKLFNFQCESKRCIVFFFRSVDEDKLTYDFQEYIQNKEFIEVLTLIQHLLSQKFIEDLVHILSSQNNINSVVDLLLQNKDDPSEYSHIIQNFFILKQLKTGLDEKTNKPKIETVRNEFEDFVKDPQTNQLVYNFVVDIITIFLGSTTYQPDIYEESEVLEADNFMSVQQ